MIDTMSARERWEATLQRRPTDRLPMDLWATPEAEARLLKHLGCDHRSMLRRLHIDQPVTVGGRYVGPSLPVDVDVFGVRSCTVQYEGGSYREATSHPLATFKSVAEIEANYRWPSPDWWDYSHIPQQLVGWEDFPVRGGGSEPFLIYAKLRGDNQAYIDLVENPEIVDYCLDRLFDLAYENSRRIFETVPGRLLFSYVAEDFGSQTGLLMSPATIRRYLLPRMRRIARLVRDAGAWVFTHSDGAIRPIIPALIEEVGSQILNPIQWRCHGMERERLKADFGEQLIFHGGVDNQQTLAFGTPNDVRREVEENIAILGDGGGYILAPCHNIQAISPPENVVAMYDTGFDCGRN